VDRRLAWSEYRFRRSGRGHDPGTCLELTPGTPGRVGWNSSVDIATRYGLDGPGIESRWAARFSAPVRTGSDAHPASYTMGTGSFPGGKRQGRGVDHPLHLAPRLKKEESYTSTPLWAFVACSRVKFTFFTFTLLWAAANHRTKLAITVVHRLCCDITTQFQFNSILW